jgi:3-hydroxyisobutyrate dehydrogenase
MSTRVAFIGLGNMGGLMAANLVEAGHQVSGFDVVPAALERARSNGIITVGTGLAAVVDAQVVITMLPSGKHLLDAYSGENGLLAAAPPKTLFLDCSTVDVADARAARNLAVAAGHRAVDAPVSGGTVGAQAGTLTFMVGAEEADFVEVAPLLHIMGATVVHCGGSGAGQAAKICNNMILGISMIAVSEALVLGEKLGLSHQALFDVASRSSGQCWALTTNCPVPGPVPTSPANRDYQPGFMGALMSKDLGLALNAIEDTGVAAELGPRAAQIYRRFAESAEAGSDFSAIINTIRDASAAPVGITAAAEPAGQGEPA